jgi:hypothetical protein
MATTAPRAGEHHEKERMGKLVLAEHVRSPQPVVRAGQRVLAPLMLRLEGDHLLRDPVDHVSEAGFVVEELYRSRLGIVERMVARKPL